MGQDSSAGPALAALPHTNNPLDLIYDTACTRQLTSLQSIADQLKLISRNGLVHKLLIRSRRSIGV
ncbi:hypothetical protein [Pseudomonas fluorescens]|uniref:Uncharacterized protein n=1 Tax=Pseudomonas fluorescens TaxID=294 RepID=A0A944HGL2_PSEFL|nr:hypothetical protein [Pseudomonas fluorescens]MBT2316757.1 hypothetical protein [Pseudomonas fluorescens]MBT2329814.1 hypothetical protein [Pseudomonas fluorescens]MBT2344576.1 hypothetical protein [Pseudomonas fluorescens]MBT2348034.1 hypothetical protein [Pseudomonas fluorescens]